MKLNSMIVVSTILLVVVSILIPSYMAIVSFKDELEDVVISDLQIMSTNSMDKISRVMNQKINDLQILTSIENRNLMGSNLDIKEKINYLRDFEIHTQAYTSISIYDVNGIKIGDTRSVGIGEDASSEIFFSESVSGKLYHDSVPIRSENLGIPILRFSGPLYDDNRNIIGVIVLNFSLNKINDVLNTDTIYSKSLEVQLISNEGLIFYSNPPYKGILSNYFDMSNIKKFLQSKDSVSSYFVEHEDDSSLFVVVKQNDFLDYAGDDWILVIKGSTNILFEEKNKLITNFTIFAFVILCITIISSIIIANYISSPIKKLENEMKNVMQSNFDIDTNVGGNEEIKSMSNSIQKMLKEIKQVSVQKEEFIAMISHELKTPLTPILMWAGALQDKKFMGELNEKQTKAINTINSCANDLSSLISDIFDSYKLDLEKIKFIENKINLYELMKEILETSDTLVKQHKITIVNTTKENTLVYGDKKRIEQIFKNLLTNAIDFVDNNTGKIEINASVKGENVEFFVKDNGTGIKKEFQDQLFKKFYQVDSSMTRIHGGSGLGLSICQGLVKGMNGKIWFESEYKKETTFYFSLPIVKKSKK